jgi:hypothetical protein
MLGGGTAHNAVICGRGRRQIVTEDPSGIPIGRLEPA